MTAPSLPLLAFAAHPDDLEFGCGAILFQHARHHPVHCIITTRGEAASHGNPDLRAAEARAASQILGATLDFLPLAPDARLQPTSDHALTLAAAIRTHKPALLLAPTLVENQHPDHAALGRLVQTAARLARYAGLPELKALPPHSIGALLFYAVTSDAEPAGLPPLLIDVSAPDTLAAWTAAINAHASQLKTRDYLDPALTRAHLHGLRGGVSHALPLFPNDPLLLPNLDALDHTARHF